MNATTSVANATSAVTTNVTAMTSVMVMIAVTMIATVVKTDTIVIAGMTTTCWVATTRIAEYLRIMNAKTNTAHAKHARIKRMVANQRS